VRRTEVHAAQILVFLELAETMALPELNDALSRRIIRIENCAVPSGVSGWELVSDPLRSETPSRGVPRLDAFPFEWKPVAALEVR
jgi:hypothetical protein